MLQMTTKKLEEILVKERKNAHEDGMFGIAECKKSIKWQMETFKQTLKEVYVELVKRALTENGFNTYMIVACEQMMEENNNELNAHIKTVCKYAWNNRQKLSENTNQLIKWVIENVKIDCKALNIEITCTDTYLRQQVLNELYAASEAK